jgi:hypothetical protein
MAFFTTKPNHGDLGTKNEAWWNGGERPDGLRTVGIFGTLSTNSPDVYIFEADGVEDIHKLTSHWQEFDFEIHPAVDLAGIYRQQGMKVD